MVEKLSAVAAAVVDGVDAVACGQPIWACLRSLPGLRLDKNELKQWK